MNKKRIKVPLIAGAIVLTVALTFGGVALARNRDVTSISGLNSCAEYCRGCGPGPGAGVIVFNDTLTGLLGMPQDEIQAQLREGKSLVEIAATKGVDAQTLVNTLVDAVKTKLQEAVANQDITQKVADSTLQRTQDNISQIVNNKFTPPAGPRRMFYGGLPFGGKGPRNR